jgi:pimeloyl-ACP methyl ester carboxylesterase
MNHWQLPHRYDFDGRCVRYGKLGDGPPLVVVHGTPWSSFNLRHLIHRLANHYSVYFYDLLGYGQSCTTTGDVSLGVQNQVLDSLLSHWGLENPIILGHDFGGATVLRTHLLNQRAFSKMILIDPVALSPWGSAFFRHVHKYQEAFAGLPDYIHQAVVQAYVQTAAVEPLDDETLQGIIAPWSSEQSKIAFYRQMSQADSSYTDEVEPNYSTITVPTLILWGREDSWIPVERGEKLQAMIPGSKLKIIDGAGHLVIEERPEQLYQAIMEFVG